jgi:flagellar export protein FliJ
MAFRYPLQSVLRLRRSLERQEEQRLFALAAVVARLRVQIEELERIRLEGYRLMLEEMASGCSGAAVQFAATRERAATEARSRLQARLKEAERQRLEQLEAYQKAHQTREIFEGLRGRREAIYEREAAHRQQEQMDESFLTRHVAATLDAARLE